MWTVPDEIKDAVAALERQEREHAATNESGRLAEEAEKAVARQLEVERIKGELKGTVKRKAPEAVPVGEVVVTKKAKVEAEEEVEGEGDADDSDESEEEEWQREAAAQLAAEAEEERRIREEEAKRAREVDEAEANAKAQEAKGSKGIVMPEHVEISIEEGKALFKVGYPLLSVHLN